MTITTRALSPQFDSVAIRAIGVLRSAYAQLTDMYERTADLRDENELMYLSSIALWNGHLGMHLVEVIPDARDVHHSSDLVALIAQLIRTHDELIDHTSGLDDFIVLEFVAEVGSLCFGVRRYVERH